MWLTEKYPSLLEDFQTGTASMARKRHLASTARGFCGFCLMTHMSTLMRSLSCGVLPSRQRLRGELSLSEGVAPGYSK